MRKTFKTLEINKIYYLPQIWICDSDMCIYSNTYFLLISNINKNEQIELITLTYKGIKEFYFLGDNVCDYLKEIE